MTVALVTVVTPAGTVHVATAPVYAKFTVAVWPGQSKNRQETASHELLPGAL